LTRSYDDLLAEAARLRRAALVSAERIGETRKLLVPGADHVAVRRWINLEQATAGLLQFELRRRPCGRLAVDVSAVTNERSALELLTELAGE
jgi:hypothetical protein